MDADEWIDHPDAGKFTIIEDSRRTNEGVVLTIVWWKDEAQILALERDDDDEGRPELSGELTFGPRVRRR